MCAIVEGWKCGYQFCVSVNGFHQNLADYLRGEEERAAAPGPAEFFAPLIRILKDGDGNDDEVLAQLLVWTAILIIGNVFHSIHNRE